MSLKSERDNFLYRKWKSDRISGVLEDVVVFLAMGALFSIFFIPAFIAGFILGATIGKVW